MGACYPIAANLFLSCGGVQKAFESKDDLQVDFRRAWSFWPGRVHADAVRITMQDRNVQFELEIPKVDVTIRLRDLLHRTFHATRVRGDGVVFRFRNRVQPESAGAAYVSAYPPVAGFADPPLYEAGPPTAPLDEAHYNLWTVHIEDVDIGVSELWAQMVRYQGAARVHGAFRLRPAKRLWVGPAELDFQSGNVTIGPDQVLHGMRGTLTCKVDDFDTESANGMQPFRFISARLKLAAGVTDLSAWNFLSGPSPRVTLTDGNGVLETDLGLDHGVVTAGSRVLYRAGHATAAIADTRARLDGDLSLRATAPEGSSGGRAAIELGGATLQFDGDRFAPLEIASAVASASDDSLDVVQDWSFTGARADVKNASVPDLRWIDELPFVRGRSPGLDRGRADFDGSATVSKDYALAGKLAVRVHDAAGHAGEVRWHGGGHVSSSFRADSIRGDRLNAHAEMDLRDLDVATADFTTEVPRASISGTLHRYRGTTAHLEVRTGGFTQTTGDLRVVGASIAGSADLDASSFVTTAAARDLHFGTTNEGTCPWGSVALATVSTALQTSKNGASATGVHGSLARASLRWGEFTAYATDARFNGAWDTSRIIAHLASDGLRFENAGGAPRGWQADAATTSIDAALTTSGETTRGPVEIKVERLAGQVGKTRIGAELTAKLNVQLRGDSHRAADLSGVISTRKVALGSSASDVEDWWANFALDRAHVDTKDNFDFRGKVRAQLRDGLPVLSVLAAESQIPKWVPTLLPLQGLTLDLDVDRVCRWTDVHIVNASGGPLSATGRVQVEPGDTRGAVLVRLAAFKPVSLGVSFTEDSSDTAPLVGQGWYASREQPLSSIAKQKRLAVCVPQPPQCQ